MHSSWLLSHSKRPNAQPGRDGCHAPGQQTTLIVQRPPFRFESSYSVPTVRARLGPGKKVILYRARAVTSCRPHWTVWTRTSFSSLNPIPLSFAALLSLFKLVSAGFFQHCCVNRMTHQPDSESSTAEHSTHIAIQVSSSAGLPV